MPSCVFSCLGINSVNRLLISFQINTFRLSFQPFNTIYAMDQLLFWLVPAASVLALCFAWYFHRQMMKESEGTPQMVKIAAAVRKGAMSYLRQQYKIVGWVFRGAGDSVFCYGLWLWSAELLGADSFPHRRFLLRPFRLSWHETATYASARTANAARNSLNSGLRIAFRSGAVMGLVVVGLGLLDISFWYLLLNAVIPVDVMTPTHKLCIITTTMLTFGMGLPLKRCLRVWVAVSIRKLPM